MMILETIGYTMQNNYKKIHGTYVNQAGKLKYKKKGTLAIQYAFVIFMFPFFKIISVFFPTALTKLLNSLSH